MQTNETQSTKAIIKLTFEPTRENRVVVLPEVSFDQLASKACSLFNFGQPSSINMYYFDDEADRVTVSFDDELSYAVETSSPEPLHLFITPINQLDSDPKDEAALKDGETSNSESEVEGDIKPWCKHHGRKHQHLHRHHHHDHHPHHPYGHHAPHSATEGEEEMDQCIVKPLLKQLEEKGFGGNKGKDKRNECLLRKFNYDVALAEAFLIERRAMRHEARTHHFKGHKMAFHRFHHDEVDGCGGHERKHRCSECLFRKMDGDHHGHWKAHFKHRRAGKHAWPKHHHRHRHHHTHGETDGHDGAHERTKKDGMCVHKRCHGDHAQVEAWKAKKHHHHHHHQHHGCQLMKHGCDHQGH